MSPSEPIIDQVYDTLGPVKIINVYEPVSGLRGIVVVDNVACGPAIGGIRMASDVSVREVCRLARAMTLKNAAAGLPHGGGKAGIIADPRRSDKRRLIRQFARAVRDLVEYIPGPDMGTDEDSMAIIHDEIRRAVGLPRVFGGIPLDEIGATGYGLSQCAEVAAEFCGLDLRGARVAVEGFGNVGRHAARFLAEKGARLVAASDSAGAIHNPAGLDVAGVAETKAKTGSVVNTVGAQKLNLPALFEVDCDILIPAARPDSIHAGNAQHIKARLILQGANIPVTPEAEQILFDRGVINVPDFIANAGGVICAAIEYHGGTQSTAFAEIADRIRQNTEEVLIRSRDEQITPRQAALKLAYDRVQTAMALRSAC
jgi:glutamate dehydrogenase/leucine dehydrogenase